MNLFLLGATGNAGGAMLERALGRGYRVTALVREPARLQVQNAALTVVRGDAADAAVLSATLPGHDAVLSALSAGTQAPTTQLSDTTRAVIRAIETAGIKRLVVTLAAGIATKQVLPQFANINAEHQRVLADLRASALNWTALCPPYITHDPATGVWRAVVDGMPPGGNRISRLDLADFGLDVAAGEAYLGQTVGVAN